MNNTLELKRERDRLYYARNRESKTAKVMARHWMERAEYIQGLSNTWKKEIALAQKSGEYVMIQDKKKYRRCQNCGHYYDHLWASAISPTGQMVERWGCTGCHAAWEKVIYCLE
jgi:hypothetical protein